MPIPDQLPALPDIRNPVVAMGAGQQSGSVGRGGFPSQFDPNTGCMTSEWYDYFSKLNSILEYMRTEIP